MSRTETQGCVVAFFCLSNLPQKNQISRYQLWGKYEFKQSNQEQVENHNMITQYGFYDKEKYI